MELVLLLLVISGPMIVLFAKALRWTNPTPDQPRGRRRALAVAFVGLAIITGLAIAGGVAEGVLAERHRGNEWGSGFVFLFVLLGFPLLAPLLAVFWTVPLSTLRAGWRAFAAIALGMFSAVPIWLILFALMVQVAAAFDR